MEEAIRFLTNRIEGWRQQLRKLESGKIRFGTAEEGASFARPGAQLRSAGKKITGGTQLAPGTGPSFDRPANLTRQIPSYPCASCTVAPVR
jgi:hypothetical protein